MVNNMAVFSLHWRGIVLCVYEYKFVRVTIGVVVVEVLEMVLISDTILQSSLFIYDHWGA